MDIHDTSKMLATGSHSRMSEQKINELLKEFPFASALHGLKCQILTESNKLSVGDLRQASTHFSHSSSLLDHCIAPSGNNSVEDSRKAEIDQTEKIDAAASDELNKSTEQTNPRLQTGLMTASQTEVEEKQSPPQDAKIDKLTPRAVKDSEVMSHDQHLDDSIDTVKQENEKLMTVPAVAMPKKGLLDLEHLSDYGSWLLQLKNIDSGKPVVEAESEEQEERQHIDKDVEQAAPEITPNQTANSSKRIDGSSRLNDQIASESLANLLAEQGYRKKAIDMYKKLSLIIPEKSAYFASQIEKIKEK